MKGLLFVTIFAICTSASAGEYVRGTMIGAIDRSTIELSRRDTLQRWIFDDKILGEIENDYNAMLQRNAAHDPRQEQRFSRTFAKKLIRYHLDRTPSEAREDGLPAPSMKYDMDPESKTKAIRIGVRQPFAGPIGAQVEQTSGFQDLKSAETTGQFNVELKF